MKYKVDDTITIRGDLKLTRSSSFDVVENMLQYAGKEAKILKVWHECSYQLDIDQALKSTGYNWTDEMFEDELSEKKYAITLDDRAFLLNKSGWYEVEFVDRDEDDYVQFFKEGTNFYKGGVEAVTFLEELPNNKTVILPSAKTLGRMIINLEGDLSTSQAMNLAERLILHLNA